MPKDSFLVETLMEVYKDVTKDMDAVPQVDGVCSYARALDNCVRGNPAGAAGSDAPEK